MRGDRGQYLRAAGDGLKCLPLLKTSRELEPTNKDILFGQGIYNYFAEVMPREFPVVRPIMWLLPEGDREKGLQQLREVSEEGRYARTEATYFLAQIHRLFEKDRHRALEYLEKLYARYPDNALFHRFTARTLVDLGQWDRGIPLYEEVIRRSHQARPGYHVRGHIEALYQVGKFTFYQRRLRQAEENFAAVDSLGQFLDDKDDRGYVALANLFWGMSCDLQGKREAAVARYERVEHLGNHENSRKLARKYLQQPYTAAP